MSDLFQNGVPYAFIDKVMEVITETPWHTYQILTKRSENMRRYFEARNVPANARPMKEQWVLNIRQQCEARGVDFFFKQWGTWGANGIKRSKQANGRLLQGQIWDMIPAVAV